MFFFIKIMLHDIYMCLGHIKTHESKTLRRMRITHITRLFIPPLMILCTLVDAQRFMITFEDHVRACDQTEKLPRCADGGVVKCYGRRLLVNLEQCISQGENVKLYSIFYPLQTTVERDADITFFRHSELSNLPWHDDKKSAWSNYGKQRRVFNATVSGGEILPTAYDRAVPTDWHLTGPNSVYASDAWAEGVIGSPDVIIAVIDSGLDPLAHDGYFEHPVVPGRDFCSDPLECDDNDGRDTDFHEPASCGMSHGTVVALAVAAKKKAVGDGQFTQGVAPGVRIMPIRTVGCEYGSQSDLADSIAWAAGAPFESIETNPNVAKVISISLGGLGPCSSYLQNSISFAHSKGIPVVVSAGNRATTSEAFFPNNCQHTIVVGASTIYGHLAEYSNTHFDIAAPGGDDNAGIPINYPSKGLIYVTGTSFSTPIVSGVMVLGMKMYGNDFIDIPGTQPWGTDKVFFGASCISNGIISIRGQRMLMKPCPSLWEEAMPVAQLPWEHYRPWGYDHDRDMRDIGVGLIWVSIIAVCLGCIWVISFCGD